MNLKVNSAVQFPFCKVFSQPQYVPKTRGITASVLREYYGDQIQKLKLQQEFRQTDPFSSELVLLNLDERTNEH